MRFETPFNVVLYDDYDKDQRWAAFQRFDALRWSSRLNGGFKALSLSTVVRPSEVWPYLALDNLSRGRFFGHIEVKEGERLLWEGQVASVGFDPSGVDNSLQLEALGYWWTCNNQLYDDDDVGATDFELGSSNTFKDVVADILTQACPDINSDQSNLDDPGVTVDGTTAFHDKKHPQEHILNSGYLADAAGDQWYFAIWAVRKPHLFERSTSTLHWTIDREALGRGSRISQDASWWRNKVLPVVGGTEGTAVAGDRPSGVPLRELAISLPADTPTAIANAERDRVLAERNKPQQSQRFVIRGTLLDTSVSGQAVKVPVWRVRAGEVLRIRNLIPATISTVELDNARTFYLVEVEYDARENTVTVSPDRATTTVSALLTQQGSVER